MDTRTGHIYSPEEVAELKKKGLDTSHLKQMELPPTDKQMKRRPPKVGRNELCPCGSGKKFKKCCLDLQRRP